MDNQELLRAKAMAPVFISSLVAVWDSLDIIQNQVNYLKDEDEDIKKQLDEGLLTEDQLFCRVSQDYDLFQFEHECMVDNLTEYINKLNPDGYWKAEVSGFGWRGLDGHKYFSADTGSELLSAVLPQTDCTYRIFRVKARRWLAIQNFHHDSPMGREWYIIKPCAQSTYEEYR